MYHGEVNVAQEDLNSFLSVAEDLKVKGLTQANSQSTHEKNPKQESNATKTAHERELSSFLPSKKNPCPSVSERAGILEDQTQDEIQEITPPDVIKTEPFHVPANRVDDGMEVAEMNQHYAVEGYNDYNEYDGQTYYETDETQGYEGYGPAENSKGVTIPTDIINGQILEDPSGLGYTCALCGKGFGINKNHCRRHIKNFHDQSSVIVTCEICKKCYKNKDSLRHHQRTTHGLYKQQ